ncbi:outer membrane protein assembly factor BamE [Candidatus Pelagibacter sp.]|nr:outer membrane protein assembly factor BamE [Candidatus Pelagibacter sp.]
MKNLLLISLMLIIVNCSLNLVDDHHGVYFIEKKMKRIQVNSTNKNDIVKIFGEPSTKSTFDNDVWIYIERKITNTHFLGKRELKVNNVLVLEIDDRGLLAKIEFYNKEDMNKLNFSKDSTEISYGKRSFIYDFLSSMRQKINDPLGVRKKRREQGQ